MHGEVECFVHKRTALKGAFTWLKVHDFWGWKSISIYVRIYLAVGSFFLYISHIYFKKLRPLEFSVGHMQFRSILPN